MRSEKDGTVGVELFKTDKYAGYKNGFLEILQTDHDSCSLSSS